MALPTVQFAQMVVDPSVPRAEITRLTRGMTPAKVACTLALLTPVEILQAMQKMRVRRTPSITAKTLARSVSSTSPSASRISRCWSALRLACSRA